MVYARRKDKCFFALNYNWNILNWNWKPIYYFAGSRSSYWKVICFEGDKYEFPDFSVLDWIDTS
jgi:hypothetical protein